MKNETQETTLREWTTPRLLRLNQADGTEKHLIATESVYCAGDTTTLGGYSNGSGNGAGVCGPS